MGKFRPPTPALEGEDAEKLLGELKNHASPEEMKERITKARLWKAQVEKQKESWLDRWTKVIKSSK
jgi:hypothetical protein